jgi:hypothetical protein
VETVREYRLYQEHAERTADGLSSQGLRDAYREIAAYWAQLADKREAMLRNETPEP